MSPRTNIMCLPFIYVWPLSSVDLIIATQYFMPSLPTPSKLLPLFSVVLHQYRSSKTILHVIMSPHPAWTTLAFHSITRKIPNLPPNVPSLY